MKRLFEKRMAVALALMLMQASGACPTAWAGPAPGDRDAQLNAMRNNIAKRWKSPGNAKLRAIVSFKVEDTNPKNVEIYNSSKDSKFDAAARAAVLPLIPFKVDGFKPKTELRARFDPYIHVVDVYQAEDVDFGPYMAAMQKAVKKHWFPPRGSESKHTVVLWKIQNDGTITNVRLDKSSGSPNVDEASLKAVRALGKFRPLPAGAPDSIDIQFTFDYNVHGGAGGKTGKNSSATASSSGDGAARVIFEHIDQFLKP